MHHLAGVTEVAAMLGVSKQRVVQLARDYDDFPAPVAELSSGRVWSTAAVETWQVRHSDRGPGTRQGKRRGE
ncbi:MAG: DNA-binding protein [Frankia sp.]|nr:DNA-binding protein [Frankia sp.]